MNLKDKVVLVTGAKRGLGLALVQESLKAGARRVYAGARDPKRMQGLFDNAEGRVTPLQIDITDAASLEAAAQAAPDVEVVFNNAGVLASFNVLTSAPSDIARDFATNLFGLLAASKAFLPALERAGSSGQSALVNVLSVVSLSNMPALGGYSASKAAAYSVTQALRFELAKRNIDVHAVFAGAIDTDMVRTMEMPKTSAQDVARAIVARVAQGALDIFPDPMSQGLFDTWRRDPKELEQQFASMSG